MTKLKFVRFKNDCAIRVTGGVRAGSTQQSIHADPSMSITLDPATGIVWFESTGVKRGAPLSNVAEFDVLPEPVTVTKTKAA